MENISLEEVNYAERYAKLEAKRWLNPVELEMLTGWSKSWQSKSRMCSSKIRLPHKKVGNFVIYDRYEIDAFIEEHTVVGV